VKGTTPSLRSLPGEILPADRKGPQRAATLGFVPPHGHEEPPRSLLLVHGAGSGPWIFDGWADTFPTTNLVAIDLQDDVDIRQASMSHYAGAIERAAKSCPRPLAAVAWSMGGLVTMMAAEAIDAMCLVVLEPSAPAETQGSRPRAAIDPGTFEPEVVYGPFPPGIRSRPESSFARAERKAGISVPTLPCPSLVVSGSEFPLERGSLVAALYGSGELHFPRLDHWGLVLDRRVREAIATHLSFSPRRNRGCRPPQLAGPP
jgi:pimeloyl-ACP methyl ester carboxylesterase